MSVPVEVISASFCDRCPRRATHTALLTCGGVLTFCDDCTQKHAGELTERGHELVSHEEVERNARRTARRPDSPRLSLRRGRRAL